MLFLSQWITPLLLSLPALSSAFPQFANNTVSDSKLQTWWHQEGVIDSTGSIPDGSIRQSHKYAVQVAPVSNQSVFYDSFIYESIPRNGNGAITVPGDHSSVQFDAQDGVTIEPLLNTTMAWTQFLYNEDVILKITRIDNTTAPASTANMTIRPTTNNYTTAASGASILVRVPFQGNGTRFSIEFEDDLVNYRTMATSPTCVNSSSVATGDCSYVQNVNHTSGNFFTTFNSSMPTVGVEPRNALLIFASPFPSSDLVAQYNAPGVQSIQPGYVEHLDQSPASTLFFPPGVFWLGGKAHAYLSQSTTWVYLSPGAYVKGAFQFTATNASSLTISGFGILSGEQYVYMANPEADYSSQKSDTTCLRMFKGQAAQEGNTTFTLTGITMANPPFNSMDFTGDSQALSTNAWDYKQVGAWFDQTDGLETYPNSVVHDLFYHSSDDTLKLYHSNVSISDVIIWKKTNGPAIQLGWNPRNVSDVTVTNVSQIHSRYFTNDAAGTTGDALIMSTVFPDDATNMNTADTSCYLANVSISNLRAEGISPSLMRLSPLMNYDDLHVQGAWIEELSPIETGLQTSWAHKWTDGNRNGQPVQFGANSPTGMGVRIEGFYVGSEKIGFAEKNWDTTSLGSLDFDDFFWGGWTVQ
ncbi:MAG: hypothetical protein Q9159_000554 [Coniocarpon cinnabarinum]